MVCSLLLLNPPAASKECLVKGCWITWLRSVHKPCSGGGLEVINSQLEDAADSTDSTFALLQLQSMCCDRGCHCRLLSHTHTTRHYTEWCRRYMGHFFPWASATLKPPHTVACSVLSCKVKPFHLRMPGRQMHKCHGLQLRVRHTGALQSGLSSKLSLSQGLQHCGWAQQLLGLVCSRHRAHYGLSSSLLLSWQC